jgi:4-amino-4-deoxy-L-arabinose transferase-like glycosyltransferase
VLCLAWLLPGLIGHAPWKGGDASNFIRFLALWQHGDWLTPGSAMEVFPPLYSWMAAATAWLSSPLLALHNGARLASGLFIAVALFFTARAAEALFGEDHRWPAALAVLGSVGLLLRGHEMNAYTAQLAGVAMVLDGLARLPKDVRSAGTLSAGLTVMLLATGLIEPLALAILAAVLPVFSPLYRTPMARRGLVWGLLTAILLGLAWVALLWFQHAPLIPALQIQRWPFWAQTAYTFKPFYVIGLLPWFLWPTLPLAAWALYRTRRPWRETATFMPLAVLLTLFMIFSISISSGEDKLLALIAPTAVLASAGVRTLRRGAAYAFLWFGVMLFGFLGIVFWVYWSAHDLAMPARLARRLIKLGVEDVGNLRIVPLIMGVLATAIWVIFVARLKRTPLRPLLVWSAGITFVWALLLALFLEIFDPRLSYVQVSQALTSAVPRNACINTRGVNAQPRALLAYHSELELRAAPSTTCDWLLVQSKRGKPEKSLAPRWVFQKEMRRPGDREDYFLLYARRH